MNIDYTVTALMFPAIPLLMNVYANRFHTLSALIRKIHDEYVWEKHIPPEWKKQLIYLNRIFEARIIFGSCCLAMIISIIFFIIEIQISTKALKLHLSDVQINIT